jgi:phage shock protein E
MNGCVRNLRRLSCLVLCLGIAPLWSGTTCWGGEAKSKAAPEKEAAIKNVGIEEFERLRASNKTVTLDVRTAEEYAKGHIPGAVNVDVNSKDFVEKVAALDKGQTYLVHCAAGVRSAKACTRMTRLNFTNLYNLEGGFKAWEQAGNPVEKTRREEKEKR